MVLFPSVILIPRVLWTRKVQESIQFFGGVTSPNTPAISCLHKYANNLGIRWKSHQVPFLDSGGDSADILISIFSTFAKMERVKISERTKAGLARAKAQGKQLGRRSTITDGQIQKIWNEYEREGTISRASKVVPLSKDTVYFIISNNIHSRKEYLKARKLKKMNT